MRRVTYGLFVLVIILTACARDQGTSAEMDRLSQIVSTGEMRVGYLVWPPAVVRNDRTGEIHGIFPEMVRVIAEAIDVEVVWVETSLANFAAGLNSGEFDFSVGPTFTTIPRAAAVRFTQPVAYVGNAAVIRTGGDFQPESLSEVNQPGVRIAVLQGQALEEYANREFSEAEVIVLSGGNLTAPLVAVSSGQADIGFMNSVTVSSYARVHSEVTAVLMDQQVEVLPLSWATRHQDNNLATFLSNSITYLRANGRIAEAQAKQEISLLYEDYQLVPSSP